ncbi:ATP-binding protein [Algivirga pacifica]|uniref:histidine kinase n=1 Tax=Algivirga pacifica TaxID=1162670 RepID=A0ABP9D5N2_9BACT
MQNKIGQRNIAPTGEWVQPHCMIVVFREEDYTIEAISENVPKFFYHSSDELIGYHLSVLLDEQRMIYVRELLHSVTMNQVSPMNINIHREGKDYLFYLQVNKYQDQVVLEFELQPVKQWDAKMNPYVLLNRAVGRMQSASSLGELQQVVVEELVRLTQFDQVVLLQKDTEDSAQVIAEVNNGKLEPLLGKKITHCIDKDRKFFFSGDLQSGMVAVLAEEGTDVEGVLQHTVGIAIGCPEYQQSVQKAGLTSVMAIPLLQNGVLWGELIGLGKQRKYLSYEQRKVSELITQVFDSQRLLKEQERVQEKAQAKSALLNRLLESISSKTSFLEAVKEQPSPFLSLAEATGAVICLSGEEYTFGKVPPVEQLRWLKEWLKGAFQDAFFITDNIASLFSGLDQKDFSGLFAASLGEQRGMIIWFRPEKQQVYTRRPSLLSIEESKEVSQGYSLPWDSITIQYLKELHKIIGESMFRYLQEQEEQNARFRHMLRNASDIITIYEEDLSIRYISDSAHHILGFDIQQLQCCWKDLIHPEDLPVLENTVERVKRMENAKEVLVFRMMHINGNYLFIESVFQNLLNEPNIQGILSNSRDITHHVHAQKRLQKFEVAIESSSNGVLIIDNNEEARYPVSYANPRYAELLGIPLEDTLGRPCQLFELEGDNQAQVNKLRRALEHTDRAEVSMRLYRGEKPFWMTVQIYPVEDEKKEVSNYIVLLIDTTYQKKAEQKLKEFADKVYKSNEELQTFAYVASHDLQEPLRTISGFSELLSTVYKEQLDEEAQEYLFYIMQGTQRMKSLIQDLLQFSRVSTANNETRQVDLNKVVQEVVKSLQLQIEETGAVLTIGKLPVVEVNETLMAQVFQNLISNALKYRKEDTVPQVNIGCTLTDKGEEFFVEDNGIGIPSQYHDRIFVLFQRLHTLDTYQGTGIGLAICKKVVELYGGRIGVSSEEGKGSRFYFSLNN